MTEQIVDSAIAEIINVLRTVDGIENVPLNPPSVMSYAIFGLVYPGNGSYAANPIGTKRGLHNISVDVIMKEIDFAVCMKRLKPLIDSTALVLLREVSYDSDGNAGNQFNHSIETFEGLDYSWIPSGTDYAGIQVTGLHFTMNNAKLMVNL